MALARGGALLWPLPGLESALIANSPIDMFMRKHARTTSVQRLPARIMRIASRWRERRGRSAQTEGGPRAWKANKGAVDRRNSARSSSLVPFNIAGTGNGGATDGAELPAN